jgi:hypothetical protein
VFSKLRMLGVRYKIATRWISIRVKTSWQELLAVSTLCLLVAWTTFFSPVDYSGFDALGNLLTSQAILQQHTIKLDRYQGVLTGYVQDWHLRNKQGHIYYHYPLGTPILALPFVGIANIFHLDMSNREHEAFLQNVISMSSTMMVSLFCYLIFRYYLSPGYSLPATAAFVFGTSIISTIGTALWSVNFSSIFVLLSLSLVVYRSYLQHFRAYPYLMGFFLFFAYLCRPTSVIFIGLIGIYFGLKKRDILGKLLGVFFFCFLIFMVFSWMEYGQFLPDYYLPQQLGEPPDVLTAIWGHLFSPSRGLFIYSPHLLLPLFGSLVFIRRLYRQLLFWIAVLWLGLHLMLISRNSMWWGGGCFGSRMCTDALPAFLLLTGLLYHSGLKKCSAQSRWIIVGLFLMCSSIAVYINTYQGLYNTYTLDWGDSHLFDWSCPQFLASRTCLAQREFEDQEPDLQLYRLGETIYPNSRTAIFSSWYWIENSRGRKFRWSRGHTASIFFKVASLNDRLECDYKLEIQLGSHNQQLIQIFFNGKQIGQVNHDGKQLINYTFLVPDHLVKNSSDGYNEIMFKLPNAINPRNIIGKGWVRAIAVNIWKLRLLPLIN